MTITLPAWAIWALPILVGFALLWAGERESRRDLGPFGWGAFFPAPLTILGVIVLFATALIALGVFIGRWAR